MTVYFRKPFIYLPKYNKKDKNTRETVMNPNKTDKSQG